MDCTRFVEKHGIVDGIYRISGVSSQIRQLRHEFDQGEKKVDLESEIRGSQGHNRGITGLSYEGNIICDPHSVAGLCKRYFRFALLNVASILIQKIFNELLNCSVKKKLKIF